MRVTHLPAQAMRPVQAMLLLCVVLIIPLIAGAGWRKKKAVSSSPPSVGEKLKEINKDTLIDSKGEKILGSLKADALTEELQHIKKESDDLREKLGEKSAKNQQLSTKIQSEVSSLEKTLQKERGEAIE